MDKAWGNKGALLGPGSDVLTTEFVLVLIPELEVYGTMGST